MPSDYSQACITLDVQKSRGEEGAWKVRGERLSSGGADKGQSPCGAPLGAVHAEGGVEDLGRKEKGTQRPGILHPVKSSSKSEGEMDFLRQTKKGIRCH